ncbi:MAG TPA: glycoside hydrolase family 97 catalytic domain-containing protein [Verrucomicrobiae bacterium]
MATFSAPESWSVTSPGGEVKLVVRLVSRAGAGHGLSWRLEHHSATVINDSPLGLRFTAQDLARGLAFDSTQPQVHVVENYTAVHGKRRVCHNEANQLTLRFRGANSQPLEVDLRAYDNGAAFRYRVPSSERSRRLTLEAEETGFALPLDAKLWCAPSDKASTYSPAYETYYESEIAAGTPSPLGFGWSFPLLFRTADSQRWALVTETGVDPNFCGCRLSSAPKDGIYSIVFPQAGEGNGQGAANPSSDLPWEMPWRVVIVGDSLAAVVESTLVTDVCPPSRVPDTTWVKPGRVAWSWWSDQPSPKDAAKQKAFVDFAAEMGWEYVLVDANWTIMDNGNIHDVLRYGKEKGVGILLWYNSGGPHNVVTEKPRDCLTYEPVRRFELEMLKQWGVKGVKVDFFQSDKQDVIGLYHAIMRDAAAQQIMVNFHGCTLPRGWERTYPHLMSMEAVRGEECYIFDDQYPTRAPVQNTILPFTRNAVGPMDYTPVGFSDNRYPHLTTWAHELALAVVFESGWLHFADSAAAYRALPAEPKEFLKKVPVTWDDTRVVDGYPGRFVVLARRHGAAWYIAGINGENSPRELTIKPGTWLDRGSYKLATIADGPSPREFESANRDFEAGQSFAVKLLPRGGFVAVLER